MASRHAGVVALLISCGFCLPAFARPVATRMPTARVDRPLTMPSGAFDIQITGEFATLQNDAPVGMVGAGMRYGITSDTELSLGLLRYRVRTIEGVDAERLRRFSFSVNAPPVDNDIDSPIAGMTHRFVDGPFEMAGHVELELPFQSTVEVALSIPMRLHLGDLLSLDLMIGARSDVTNLGSTGAYAGFAVTGQVTKRVALIGQFEFDGDQEALLFKPGGGVAYAFADGENARADLGVWVFYGATHEFLSQTMAVTGVPFSAVVNLSLFFGEDASTDNDDFWD